MFGCIVAGRPVQTNLQQIEPEKFLFLLTNASTINHIVIFQTAPFQPSLGATVYAGSNDSWVYLGFLSNEKPSAVFKLSGNFSGDIQIGISIEPLESVLQMQQQRQLVVPKKPSRLSERLLTSFFNYAMSFVKEDFGEQVVPVKCLQDWYNQTMRKIANDPDFEKNFTQ